MAPNDMTVLGEDRFLDTVMSFQQMMNLYDSACRCLTTKLNILMDEYRTKRGHTPIETVTSRLKKPESMMRKLQRRDLPITLTSLRENLDDIAGVRVICRYIRDLYLVRDWLRRQKWVRLIGEKDYVAEPKPNGYRSLHLIVEVEVPRATGEAWVRAEIQLRTISMDSWATLEHSLQYKNHQEPLGEGTVCDLHACAELLYLSDCRMQKIAEDAGIFDGI